MMYCDNVDLCLISFVHFPIFRVAGVSNEEPLRLARHRVIAQAFAKRHDFNTAGRLSISLHSMHDDPLGKCGYGTIIC